MSFLAEFTAELGLHTLAGGGFTLMDLTNSLSQPAFLMYERGLYMLRAMICFTSWHLIFSDIFSYVCCDNPLLAIVQIYCSLV